MSSITSLSYRIDPTRLQYHNYLLMKRNKQLCHLSLLISPPLCFNILDSKRSFESNAPTPFDSRWRIWSTCSTICIQSAHLVLLDLSGLSSQWYLIVTDINSPTRVFHHVDRWSRLYSCPVISKLFTELERIPKTSFQWVICVWMACYTVCWKSCWTYRKLTLKLTIIIIHVDIWLNSWNIRLNTDIPLFTAYNLNIEQL